MCYRSSRLNMTALDGHKVERRRRILAAARRLIADRGYDGLTMRELARASRVSVPTLYSLFGGKRALLLAELEATFSTVASGLEQVRGAGLVERACAGLEAGIRDLLAMPRYTREVVHLSLLSHEARPIVRQVEERYIDLMALILREAQAAGEVVPWLDATAAARRLFAHHVQAMIEWARDDLDADEFRAATQLALALMLLGVTRGPATAELTRLATAAQAQLHARAGRRARARRG
jgi:AcrR family transcriptional regulator